MRVPGTAQRSLIHTNIYELAWRVGGIFCTLYLSTNVCRERSLPHVSLHLLNRVPGTSVTRFIQVPRQASHHSQGSCLFLPQSLSLLCPFISFDNVSQTRFLCSDERWIKWENRVSKKAALVKIPPFATLFREAHFLICHHPVYENNEINFHLYHFNFKVTYIDLSNFA